MRPEPAFGRGAVEDVEKDDAERVKLLEWDLVAAEDADCCRATFLCKQLANFDVQAGALHCVVGANIMNVLQKLTSDRLM